MATLEFCGFVHCTETRDRKQTQLTGAEEVFVRSMICYILSSPQIGPQNLFQTWLIQVNSFSKNCCLHPRWVFLFKKIGATKNNWTNDLLQMTQKTDFNNMFIFKKKDFNIWPDGHRWPTKRPTPSLEVRPSSKSTSMGSVCPVMDRGEKMERPPQLVGTGGTTFDYLQQHLETAKLFTDGWVMV